MAASTVSVFIPHAILNKLTYDSYVLGYWHIGNNNILVNCTTIIERKNQDFDSIFSQLLNQTVGEKDGIKFLGLIYSSSKEKNIETEFLNSRLHTITFKIRINEVARSFHIEHISVTHYQNISDVQVIIYDGGSLASSQLLPLNRNISNTETQNESFVSFLVGTCQKFINSPKNILSHEHFHNLKISNFTHLDNEISTHYGSKLLLVFLYLISVFYRFTSCIFKRWPLCVINVVLVTALGQQFHRRYLHCASLYADFKAIIPLSIKCKNLLFAILIDLLCGFLVTYALLNTNIPNMMLRAAILKTNDIVSSLQSLINWLMGVPAGLKLNIPLNNALGKFFLYHIYLWESYMMVVQPLFAFIFKMSTVIGVFGLTFVLSLLSDLISLATIHIYCFYGYAARLYGYQVMSLSALWRLFRGKKWNPLRQRIDSYTYTVHQLYLGTLIFTVLLFLLPTVMVYYFVFSCLRILVLVIQGVLSRIINILTVCPAYCITSRILNSSETTGDVYFTVLNTEGVLTLSMQASQIPLATVIRLTLPELKKFYEVLTWKEFVSCIIWGKIVYPL